MFLIVFFFFANLGKYHLAQSNTIYHCRHIIRGFIIRGCSPLTEKTIAENR